MRNKRFSYQVSLLDKALTDKLSEGFGLYEALCSIGLPKKLAQIGAQKTLQMDFVLPELSYTNRQCTNLIKRIQWLNNWKVIPNFTSLSPVTLTLPAPDEPVNSKIIIGKPTSTQEQTYTNFPENSLVFIESLLVNCSPKHKTSLSNAINLVRFRSKFLKAELGKTNENVENLETANRYLTEFIDFVKQTNKTNEVHKRSILNAVKLVMEREKFIKKIDI